MKMKTGKDVLHDGSYISDCCFFELVLIRQQMFPRCPKCLKLTNWANADTEPVMTKTLPDGKETL
jgi:hypothetical protein